jgi:hypothetical protein
LSLVTLAGHRRAAHSAKSEPFRYDRVFSPVCILKVATFKITILCIKLRCSLIIIACSFLMIHPYEIVNLMMGNSKPQKIINTKPVLYLISLTRLDRWRPRQGEADLLVHHAALGHRPALQVRICYIYSCFFACIHQFGLIFDARFPVCFTILFSHCSFVEKMPRIPYAIAACLPLSVCNLIHTKTAVTCPCLTWSS